MGGSGRRDCGGAAGQDDSARGAVGGGAVPCSPYRPKGTKVTSRHLLCWPGHKRGFVIQHPLWPPRAGGVGAELDGKMVDFRGCFWIFLWVINPSLCPFHSSPLLSLSASMSLSLFFPLCLPASLLLPRPLFPYLCVCFCLSLSVSQYAHLVFPPAHSCPFPHADHQMWPLRPQLPTTSGSSVCP